MRYNFDENIDRYNTNCLKYDCAAARGKPEGLLPMWVADMDFRTANPVCQAIEQTARHGIFGYTVPGEDYYEAVAAWFSKRYGYDTERAWVIHTPGVVFALAMAVRAFTKPGDAVLIQRPVYYPFTEVIVDNDRRVCSNGLVLDENSGSYGIDFADFEEKIVTEKIRLFLLCNPHNPVGRVWRREELERLGEICLRHDCVVVSDEIHCDFTFPGYNHTAFAALSEAFRDNSIVCTSPSKSFNLAGLQISNIFIADRKLRHRFRQEVNATGYSQAGITGIAACKAAYDSGDPWLAELKSYLAGNLSYLRERLQADVPAVRLIEPQGTYLAWLDFRALVKNRAEADALITKKARLWLDDGEMFGPEGAGFQRMNFACPRAVLQEAMDRLAAAVQE